MRASYLSLDGKIAEQETYKEKFDRGDAEGGGQEQQQEKEEKESDKEDDDKVIFVHYEQRKVMLSQVHPAEAPDSGTQSPSELRQVGRRWCCDPSPTGCVLKYNMTFVLLSLLPLPLQVFHTVAHSQPLFFLDKYDDGPLKLTHWQSEGREASIIVELLKQVSVPLCLLISWLLSVWTWICGLR